MRSASEQRVRLANGERWLSQRLGVWHYDAGVTTAEQRREALRQVILERGLADAACSRATRGRNRTWREAFEAVYGSPLQTDELNFAITGTEGA